MPNLLNQLVIVNARLYTPYRGVWMADLDVDLDPTGIVPTGRALLTLGTNILPCTIDDKASGHFGPKAKIRVLGGGGGWAKEVSALHFHNDAAVLSTQVYAATAAEVGEVLVDVIPEFFGVDYVRRKGPASSVLEGKQWYVTLQGITTVGPRLPIPTVPTIFEVLEWDPEQQVATVASDELVQPGMILIDPLRFGTATVRDVEQIFDGASGKARATCWCSTASTTRLVDALTALTTQKSQVNYARCYRYRTIVENVDGRLVLQAINPGKGMPDLLPISVWYGSPGVSAKLAPAAGTEVLVDFIAGDPSSPVVRAFAPGAVPLEWTVNAVAIKLNSAAVDYVVLAAGLTSALVAAVTASPITPNDGGAAFKAGLIAQLNSPGFIAAIKATTVQAL